MFQVHVPSPPLSQYIECLWYIDDQIEYRRERILPTGTIEIMLNFGSPFRVYDHYDDTEFTLNQNAWIAGLHTAYIINEPIAETHMMGIRLKPHGLSLLMDVPAHEFHNQIIDIDLIWGRDVHNIREQLYCLPTPQQKFAHLEHVLCNRLRDHHSKLDLVDYAIYRIRQADLSVRDLCQEIGISNKHLIQLFKSYVGVSPKALSNVFRFQQVLHIIDPQTEIDWVTIALNSGYYDQSHFNKAFTRFTGMSPSHYIAHRQAVFGETLTQGDGVHFVPVG